MFFFHTCKKQMPTQRKEKTSTFQGKYLDFIVGKSENGSPNNSETVHGSNTQGMKGLGRIVHTNKGEDDFTTTTSVNTQTSSSDIKTELSFGNGCAEYEQNSLTFH